MFPALAAINYIGLVPFLLAGVGGDPKLNQQDGIFTQPRQVPKY
jgi:acyl-CoA thioesterase-1